MRLISCVSVASIFSCIGLKCGLSSEHVTASVSFSLGMNPLNSHRCVSNSEKNKTWQQLSHLVAKSCHRVLRIHQKWKQSESEFMWAEELLVLHHPATQVELRPTGGEKHAQFDHKAEEKLIYCGCENENEGLNRQITSCCCSIIKP